MAGLYSVYAQQMRVNEAVGEVLSSIQQSTEFHSTTIQQILDFLQQYYQ